MPRFKVTYSETYEQDRKDINEIYEDYEWMGFKFVSFTKGMKGKTYWIKNAAKKRCLTVTEVGGDK